MVQNFGNGLLSLKQKNVPLADMSEMLRYTIIVPFASFGFLSGDLVSIVRLASVPTQKYCPMPTTSYAKSGFSEGNLNTPNHSWKLLRLFTTQYKKVHNWQVLIYSTTAGTVSLGNLQKYKPARILQGAP